MNKKKIFLYNKDIIRNLQPKNYIKMNLLMKKHFCNKIINFNKNEKYRLFRSKLFIPIIKEIPKDTFISSHQLMIRSGLITKVKNCKKLVNFQK